MQSLRKYIRSTLLQEGLAGFGNTLFLRKIVDQVEAGNIILQDDRSNKTFSDAVAFSFPRYALLDLYHSASPELQEWILKKFDNLEFFSRNFSRLKWVITSDYVNRPKALGMASDNSRTENILINNETGTRVANFSPEFIKWSKRTKGGEEEDPNYSYTQQSGIPFGNESTRAWSVEHETGYISIKVLDTQSFMKLKATFGRAREKMIAEFMRQQMGNVRSTWTHELQHWVQGLSYYHSKHEKRGVHTRHRSASPPVGPVGRTAIYLIGSKLDASVSNVKTEPPFTYADITRLSARDIQILKKSRKVNSLMNPRKDELWPQEVIDHLWSRFGDAGTKQKTKPLAESSVKQKYFSQWKKSCIGKLFGGDWKNASLVIKGITGEGDIVPVTTKWSQKIVKLRLNRVGTDPAVGKSLGTPVGYNIKKKRSTKFKREDYANQFSLDPDPWNSIWEHRIEELDAEKAANLKKVVGDITWPHYRENMEILINLFEQNTNAAYKRVKELYESKFDRFRRKGAQKMLAAEQKSMDKIAKKITDYLQECADRVDSESFVSLEQYQAAKGDWRATKTLFEKSGWTKAFRQEVNQDY